MKTLKILLITAFLALFATNVFAITRYGETLCDDPTFYCYKVKSGESWDSLFPNFEQRDVVMRLNRFNMRLYPGLVIAIPKDLEHTTFLSIAPFPLKIDAPGEKTIIVDLNKLAWGAYNPDGKLVFWGPASGGQGYCKDVKKLCRTITGHYRIFGKQTAKCISNVFPIEWEGGAPMPFCMHFYRGFALHGSYEVPGYNASHGCVRMFINDARWLNEKWTDYGTRVILLPYKSTNDD